MNEKTKEDNFEFFNEYLKLSKEVRLKERILYKSGIDIMRFSEIYDSIVKSLLKVFFSEYQIETIEWWLYENVDKVISFTDGRQSIRLDTSKQLWDYLQAFEEVE